MGLIQKPEHITTGENLSLQELSKKIYDDEEIKNFKLDEAIDGNPLNHRPTLIRSKLAYKEILKNTKGTIK